MNEPCNLEVMRDHEGRLTSAEKSAESAHLRINGFTDFVKDFTVEMRDSNKNISAMVAQVSVLTEQIKHVVEATKRHDDDIEKIKDNMETKDTVLKLYDKIEVDNKKHEKGMDAIMQKLRETEDAFESHTQEPANDALLREKALKRWLILSVGAIIASQYIPSMLNYIISKL